MLVNFGWYSNFSLFYLDKKLFSRPFPFLVSEQPILFFYRKRRFSSHLWIKNVYIFFSFCFSIFVLVFFYTVTQNSFFTYFLRFMELAYTFTRGLMSWWKFFGVGIRFRRRFRVYLCFEDESLDSIGEE